ncbi:MAG: cell wall hydrolase [Rudaea sp.]
MASIFHTPVADQTCLATTIYLEARGEPLIGQLAVAEVALRRRDNGDRSNSLCAVLRARHQFALSTTSKNFVIDDVESWRRDWLLAGMAMMAWHLPPSWRPSVVPRADHFFASDSPPPPWAKGPPLAVIGDHSFYRAD